MCRARGARGFYGETWKWYAFKGLIQICSLHLGAFPEIRLCVGKTEDLDERCVRHYGGEADPLALRLICNSPRDSSSETCSFSGRRCTSWRSYQI